MSNHIKSNQIQFKHKVKVTKVKKTTVHRARINNMNIVVLSMVYQHEMCYKIVCVSRLCNFACPYQQHNLRQKTYGYERRLNLCHTVLLRHPVTVLAFYVYVSEKYFL